MSSPIGLIAQLSNEKVLWTGEFWNTKRFVFDQRGIFTVDKQTGKTISKEEASALSEALKTNTIVLSLRLAGVQY